MKTFSLSVIEINMYDEMRAWKLLRLQDTIPGRLIYNFKSLLPVCITSLSSLFQKAF